MGDWFISRGWVMSVEVPVDYVCATTIISLSDVDMLRRQRGQGKDSQHHQACGSPEESMSYHTSSISGGQPDGQATVSRQVKYYRVTGWPSSDPTIG
jgi:hypothetical protein